MTWKMPWKVDGEEVRCEYCDDEFTDRYREFKFFFTTNEPLEAYHLDCKETFRSRFRLHIEHQTYCHLDGCEEHPAPVKEGRAALSQLAT